MYVHQVSDINCAARTIISHISYFLTIKDQIEFAASNKKLKADVFSGVLCVPFTIINVASFRLFLLNNPYITILKISISENILPNGKGSCLKPEEKCFSLLQDFFPKITHLELLCLNPVITWFDELVRLKELGIFNSNKNISACANFPKVSRLVFHNYSAYFSTNVLQSLPLEELVIDFSPLVDIQQLKFPLLRKIFIRNMMALDIPSFEQCLNLVSIELLNVNVRKLQPICYFTSITGISFRYWIISELSAY